MLATVSHPAAAEAQGSMRVHPDFLPAMDILGIRLVGLNDANASKLLLTLGLLLVLVLASAGLRLLLKPLRGNQRSTRVRFWSEQGVALAMAIVGVIGLASIWFDNPRSLSAAMGLFSAGLAFALQKVVTALAGYFLLLRGKTFTVGDRIVMGGVRGNVIALGFFQTTILEMGQPPSVQSADPAMWVKSRQFTGRIVTVSNSQIFDEPVFNYTRDFPFLWEELSVPIAYRDDRNKAEQALLQAARPHAIDPRQVAPEVLRHMEDRFEVRFDDFAPRVYLRMTDNWIEMTVRLLLRDHGTREAKDAITRDVLAALEAQGIGIASSTSEVTVFQGGA